MSQLSLSTIRKSSTIGFGDCQKSLVVNIVSAAICMQAHKHQSMEIEVGVKSGSREGVMTRD